MSESAHPRDDLVRAIFPGVELRDADPDTDTPAPPVMRGHFSVFDKWYEVDSLFEGRFMERIAPGAFARTIEEDRDSMRVLFQHGTDPVVGDKPLGPIDELEEDSKGGRYAVTLLDTSYNRDIEPGLRAGLYGSSFRFSVRGEEWVNEPKRTKANPDALPERTITDARVFEFGPVTFPANPAATAGVRSLTDEWRSRASPSRELPEPPQPPQPEPPKEAPPVEVTQISDPVSRAAAVSRTDRPARISELVALTDAFAREHTGVLSTELQGQWDDMASELRALRAAEAADQARLDFIASQLGRATSAPTSPVVDAVRPVPNVARQRVSDIWDRGEIRRVSNGKDDERQLLRDSAMRALEAVRYPQTHDAPKVQGHIASLLDNGDTREGTLAERILTTGSPQYRAAFNRYLKTGQVEERYAALTVQTDATGGYSVPFYFDPTLVHVGAHTTINPYRRACRVIPIVGTDTYHGVTAAAVLAARAAEAAAVAEGGGAIGQISAIVSKVHSMVTVSIEIFEDRADLASELGSLIAEAKDTEEESIFTVGVGDALGAGVNPIGMLCARGTTGAYTPTETATNNTFAIADLYAVEAALPIRHRMNAAWFMGRATIRAAQAMETTGGQLFGGQNYASTGYPQNDPFGNTGLRLMNYPVWEVPSAVTGVADNAIIGALVDPSSFYIIDRVGMSVEVIPHIFEHAAGSRPMGQRGIYAWWRNTAKPSNVDAGRTIAINPA